MPVGVARGSDTYDPARLAPQANNRATPTDDDSGVKLCTVCGVVTSRAGGRCTEHARQSDRSRHNALHSTRAWQRLSGRVLRAWRGQHGNWCPGYRRPAHPAADLTVDHVVPLAAGGAPFDIGNTAVLCRSCNSTKAAPVRAFSPDSRRGLAESLFERVVVLGLRRMHRKQTPAAGAAGLVEAFSSASAGYGRGERRQTTLRRLDVSVSLPLEIEVTGTERWLPRATA